MFAVYHCDILYSDLKYQTTQLIRSSSASFIFVDLKDIGEFNLPNVENSQFQYMLFHKCQ